MKKSNIAALAALAVSWAVRTLGMNVESGSSSSHQSLSQQASPPIIEDSSNKAPKRGTKRGRPPKDGAAISASIYKNKTLQELMEVRSSRLRRKWRDAWLEAFSEHPDIAALDLGKSAERLEEEIRPLRPDTTNIKASQQFCHALKYSLEIRGACIDYTNLISHHLTQYLLRLRRSKYLKRLGDPKDEDGLRRLRNHKARDRERHKSPQVMLERRQARSRTVAAIFDELLQANIPAKLSVGEMEAATRSVLNKYDDIYAIKEGLRRYLALSHSVSYVESVVGLRKKNKVKVTQNESQNRRRKPQRDKKRGKHEDEHQDQPRSPARNTSQSRKNSLL